MQEKREQERPASLLLRDLDEDLVEKEKELSMLDGVHDQLSKDLLERTEFKNVLEMGQIFFQSTPTLLNESDNDDEEKNFDPEEKSSRSVVFQFITGLKFVHFKISEAWSCKM